METKKPLSAKNKSKISGGQNISAQIAFRHSQSVKDTVLALTQTENLSEADISRLIFNAGLKARFNIVVQGNKVVDRGSLSR